MTRRHPSPLLGALLLAGCAQRAATARDGDLAQRVSEVHIEMPRAEATATETKEAQVPTEEKPAPCAAPALPSGPLRPMPEKPDLELIRELAAGRRDIADAFDPARGVDYVSTGDDATGEHPENERVAEKLCGPEGQKELKESLQDFVQEYERRICEPELPETLVPSCEGLSCCKPAYGEWDREVCLAFRRDPRGLVLDRIEATETPLHSEEDIAAQVRWQKAALRKLAAKRCR
ncbi:hypothetical protein [Polyangium aurulentum]|uniref:hypothetical protein n=1 Tax=Polyangium aurulentum TaxID=2567896 RepID=UPI0010AE85E2|nr:hypothetical protein [Polyangium aurulentum]UQA54918.1 hypothetical protein E8A73_026525 [Polyangium aurulentum]